MLDILGIVDVFDIFDILDILDMLDKPFSVEKRVRVLFMSVFLTFILFPTLLIILTFSDSVDQF